MKRLPRVILGREVGAVKIAGVEKTPMRMVKSIVIKTDTLLDDLMLS